MLRSKRADDTESTGGCECAQRLPGTTSYATRGRRRRKHWLAGAQPEAGSRAGSGPRRRRWWWRRGALTDSRRRLQDGLPGQPAAAAETRRHIDSAAGSGWLAQDGDWTVGRAAASLHRGVRVCRSGALPPSPRSSRNRRAEVSIRPPDRCLSLHSRAALRTRSTDRQPWRHVPRWTAVGRKNPPRVCGAMLPGTAE